MLYFFDGLSDLPVRGAADERDQAYDRPRHLARGRIVATSKSRKHSRNAFSHRRSIFHGSGVFERQVKAIIANGPGSRIQARRAEGV